MALSRRTGARLQANIWPGFVDAMTGLLLVLMFVLTIFMVVQAVLRDTITGQESQIHQQEEAITEQESELNRLSSEIAALAQTLGLEQQKSADLTSQLGTLESTLDSRDAQLAEQAALIDPNRIE